jgi:hypothetical protein
MVVQVVQVAAQVVTVVLLLLAVALHQDKVLRAVIQTRVKEEQVRVVALAELVLMGHFQVRAQLVA